MEWLKKHKVISISLLIIGVIIVISASSGTSDKQSSSSDNSTKPMKQEEKKETVAKIGETARDGKFEFTVKSVKCGEKQVGTNEFMTQKAQGEFCRMSLSVKNIGDKAQSLFSSDQKLINSEGQEFSADDTATMYASDSSNSTWYNEINPGNSVKGDIIFDVPVKTKITSAVLHDSAFSGGIKVNLK